MPRFIALAIGGLLVGCSTPKPLDLPSVSTSESGAPTGSSTGTESSTSGPVLSTCYAGAEIQQAIDNSESYEVIPVCAGTHVVNLIMRRPVILESEDPNDPAILDGDNFDPVISVPEYRSAVLRNLVLTNGNGGTTRGGGVDGPAADSISIEGCSIRDNSGLIGGIQGPYGGPLDLIDSVVTNNEGDYGGGVSIGQGSLIRVDISDNTATTRGGGVTVYPFQGPVIEDVTVFGNSTDGIGGGVALDWSSTWSGGRIEANTAQRGGGIGTVATSTIAITDTEIVGNTATLDGGGVYNDASIGGLMVLRNVLIDANTAVEGGGLYLQDTTDGAASFSLEYVDIQNNRADHGGGLSLLGSQADVTGGSITSNTGNVAGGGVRLAKLGVLNADNVDLGTGTTSNAPDDIEIDGTSFDYDGPTTIRCDVDCN